VLDYIERNKADDEAIIETRLAEAEEKGLEKGRQEGIEKGRLESARLMLQRGFTVAAVADILSLPETVIATLQQQQP